MRRRWRGCRSSAAPEPAHWRVLHPGQIDVLNEVFTPTQDEFDKAEAMLEAYAHATDIERRSCSAVSM